MKTIKKILLISFLLIVSVAAGYFAYSYLSKPQITPIAFAGVTYKPQHFAPQKAIITDQNLEELKQELLTIIGNESNKYTFVIKDLHTGAQITHSSDKVMPPASIYKVPLAIIVLRDVDAGKVTLSDEYAVLAKHKPYSFDELAAKPNGYKATLSELLSFLIQKSDNAAMTALEDYFGGVEAIQTNIKSDLGVELFTRTPHQTTAQDVAVVFEGLYTQSYLSADSNDLLLQMLSDVKIQHQDRIQAGLPDGIVAAHKIGDLLGTAEDAGIVYGTKRDFLIVILNKDINPGSVHSKMQRITKASYEFFNPVDLSSREE